MEAHTAITIARDEFGWTVTHGETYHDRLCWDEMLGQVVHLTHPQIPEPRYTMLTAEQWQKREADMAKSGEELSARFAAEDRKKSDAIASMRDALLQWRTAEQLHDGAEFANAQQARDEALQAANLAGLA